MEQKTNIMNEMPPGLFAIYHLMCTLRVTNVHKVNAILHFLLFSIT